MSQLSRYRSVDALKAAAIIVVIWIHAFQSREYPHLSIFQQLGFLTRFAVPAFFFASGVLYYQPSPIGGPALRHRIARIGLPYLVASLAAIALRSACFGPIDMSQAGFELLTGSAVKIYYFVPVLTGAVLLAAVLSRMTRGTWLLFGLLWVLGLLRELRLVPLGSLFGMSGFFWRARNPLRWWSYFLAGWVLAMHIRYIEQMRPAPRRGLGVAALVLVALTFSWVTLFLDSPRAGFGPILQYVAIYGIIAGIFLLTFDGLERPWIRSLSDNTYPIYLYHFLFIWLYRQFLSGWMYEIGLPSPLIDAMVFASGWFGALLVVHAGRRLLGRHAPLVIG
jgi:surface polysaccharide O-acyltransferase-like enzyme